MAPINWGSPSGVAGRAYIFNLVIAIVAPVGVGGCKRRSIFCTCHFKSLTAIEIYFSMPKQHLEFLIVGMGFLGHIKVISNMEKCARLNCGMVLFMRSHCSLGIVTIWIEQLPEAITEQFNVASALGRLCNYFRANIKHDTTWATNSISKASTSWVE